MNKLPLHIGLGSDLRTQRRARRISQEQLADTAGLSTPTVRLLERTHGNLASWHVVLRALGLEVGVTQSTILALERYGRGRLDILNRVLSHLGAGAYLIARGEKKSFFTHAGNASIHHGWETPPEILETLYAAFGK
jgi:transcriptional regulator with XRE-family HTH domain